MVVLENGWTLDNDILIPPESLDSKVAWRFIQQSIYGNHIPVTRVIGYNIVTGKIRKRVSIFNRDMDLADDKATVAYSLGTLLPVTDKNKVSIMKFQGTLRLDNMIMTYSNKFIKVLGTEEYLLTTLGPPVGMSLVLRTGFGYKDVGDNTDYIEGLESSITRRRVFTIPSYHSIIDFVNVIPYMGEPFIKLRYMHGMNEEIFSGYLKDLFEKPRLEWKMQNKEVYLNAQIK